MDGPTLHSIWTVIVFVTFIGIVLWAWSGRRRSDFERAARIPLDDEAVAAREPFRAGEGGADG